MDHTRTNLQLFLAIICLCFTNLAIAETNDPHAAVFEGTEYPLAEDCGDCHEKVFKEWARSNHAYASISPMFHAFEQEINDLTSGTIDSFCVRCHQQVGTQLGEERELPLWERNDISREGITCITCHRVNKAFGKVNGERDIEPGLITDPIYGAGIGKNLQSVIDNPDLYYMKEKVSHSEVIKFEQLDKSQFCVSCHQVAVNLGIKLEVVWEQYRDSPAAKDGVSCQECHMGAVPGEAEGYELSHIAVINGQAVGEPTSKHSNHAFFGPGYPISHPGLFPYNRRAKQWTMPQWLDFNFEESWGIAEWEDQLENGDFPVPAFPEAWSERPDRVAARKIIDTNIRQLELKKKERIAVMENGSRIHGPFFKSDPKVGKNLSFYYTVKNIDRGHNFPSGSLGAQPQLWLNVALIDPDGQNIWESGYVDSSGDMADLHSLDVAAGTIEHDDQLFNLQTKFLTTNVKGTDREMYLPVNFDVDQLPHLRPANVPTTVMNHPPFVRMEGRSLPPESERNARYKVPGKLLNKSGKYKLLVRMRSRAEPLYFMKFVGASSSMEKQINKWMIDIHPYAAEFEVR
jgi:nitrate/TMAO reductase-like tetraheme cytochrome c subunit